MKNEITTKDLLALNELMTFENWIAVKMLNISDEISSDRLGNQFREMAKIHAMHHKNILDYVTSNSN
ncbi:MAG: hypothetical protein PHR96_01815 [Clostridia bacterium]|nr:hypothetical protein [Clostridia bacterium]